MFQPFVTTKSLGTGLGLSISRKLAETLGGVLELRPREPHGALAEIRFPKLEVEHGTEEINPAWKQF